MFILFLISRIICLPILAIIDFILYHITIFMLFLITNFITTLIWYFPSIYQLYSFIFTEKEIDLRIRIYLFLFSPLIIISYIPFCIIVFIGYGIFVTLINQLVIIFLRPEYPLYSLSSTAALIYFICRYCHDDYPIE